MITASNDFRIREKSWLARLAALALRSNRMAIVFGNTIHLFHVSKTDFLLNEKWLKHELCHIDQFRKYGTLRFTFMYAWETLWHSYRSNRFEVEARRFAQSKP